MPLVTAVARKRQLGVRFKASDVAIKKLLALADVRVDGDRPWDIQVNDPRLYARVLTRGSLGLGEAYMDGWWDCEALDQFFHKVLEAKLEDKVTPLAAVRLALQARFTNMQSRSRAFKVGEHHYDLGNYLFEQMLDERMTYSCGYWKDASNLDEAQEAKLELICQKLYLRPGMRVLDIGCGWGSLAQYAAGKYGAHVVGITVSKEQVPLARERCKGLPVEIRLQDYRDLSELFDRVVSVGMFEHVGYRNYEVYMKVVGRCLKPEGLFLLHTIGCGNPRNFTDPWLNRYIFPNGMLPSTKQIAVATDCRFTLEDWHNFGTHYDNTLMAWHRNFTQNWERIGERYDERFSRMWTYFLLSCAGSFRARWNHVWQIVFSKSGSTHAYASIR